MVISQGTGRINGYEINNLRFADDIAAITESEQDLQLLVDKMAQGSSKMGMKINAEKRKQKYK